MIIHKRYDNYIKIIICFVIVIIVLRWKKYVYQETIHISLNENSNNLTCSDYCTFYKCSNIWTVYKNDFYVQISKKIKLLNYPNSKNSLEFNEIFNYIQNKYSNEYYSKKATILIPNIDLLFTNDLYKIVSSILAESKENDVNWLIFNFYTPINEIDKLIKLCDPLIIGSANFYTSNYRYTVDISIPFYNPHITRKFKLNHKKFLFTITQKQANKFIPIIFTNKVHNEFRCLVRSENCGYSLELKVKICYQTYNSISQLPTTILLDPYEAQSNSTFCLLFDIDQTLGLHLYNAIAHNCIPIIFTDRYILPFSEVLDWSKFSIKIPKSLSANLLNILENIDEKTIKIYQKNMKFIFERYMSTIKAIVDTTLQIAEDRFFSQKSPSHISWNEPDYNTVKSENRNYSPEQIITKSIYPDFFLKDSGYSAIIFNDYNCLIKSQQVIFDIHLHNILATNYLVHLIFVYQHNYSDLKTCLTNKDILGEYHVTFIHLHEDNSLEPNVYSHINSISSEAIYITNWNAKCRLITTNEINQAYKIWFDKTDTVISLTGVIDDVNNRMYPIDAVFVNKTLLDYVTEHWANNRKFLEFKQSISAISLFGFTIDYRVAFNTTINNIF